MSYFSRLPIIPHCSINQRHTEILTDALIFGHFSQIQKKKKEHSQEKPGFSYFLKKLNMDMLLTILRSSSFIMDTKHNFQDGRGQNALIVFYQRKLNYI